MTAQEKRQAARIIRNAKPVEVELFELIEELQEARLAKGERGAYEWQSAMDHLQGIQDSLLAVHNAEDATQFDRELAEQLPPGTFVSLRMIL